MPQCHGSIHLHTSTICLQIISDRAGVMIKNNLARLSTFLHLRTYTLVAEPRSLVQFLTGASYFSPISPRVQSLYRARIWIFLQEKSTIILERLS